MPAYKEVYGSLWRTYIGVLSLLSNGEVRPQNPLKLSKESDKEGSFQYYIINCSTIISCICYKFLELVRLSAT